MNRNYSYEWGLGSGSSPSPCAETYRGPSATSEPEVAALQSFISSIFTTGPQTNILITLHSYGNFVLYPWGYTSQAAPDEALLDQLGNKLAQSNFYLVGQPWELLSYTASGTTDDWSYGALGVPSFTFECGEWFYQDCIDLPGILSENRPAFIYAGRVADAPYLHAAGPDPSATSVFPAAVPPGVPVHLQTMVSDALSGMNNISAAEAYLDLPPEASGSPIAMAASDGAFNSVIEQVYVDLDTSLIPIGRHLLLVRGIDATGKAGALDAVFLNIGSPNLITGTAANPANPLARVRLFSGP
jgi:hypothetical protein